MNDSRIAPVFQILAEDIHALGVRTVFGLMSDDTAVFAVTLDGLGVKFVGARHENNAIAMAEGYAYATGELGVAVIGRGPATANGLHAAVAASRDRKSTRLNSSHLGISYAVFCLKKKNNANA